jgi:hypothetical protein
MRKHEHELRREIARAGLTLIDLIHNRHMKMVVGRNGAKRTIVVAVSPSDRGAIFRVRRDLRRAARELAGGAP